MTATLFALALLADLNAAGSIYVNQPTLISPADGDEERALLSDTNYGLNAEVAFKVVADVDEHPEPRSGRVGPALGDPHPFGGGQRGPLSRRAADEHTREAVGEHAVGLQLDAALVDRAVGTKRRVGSGDEAGESRGVHEPWRGRKESAARVCGRRAGRARTA